MGEHRHDDEVFSECCNEHDKCYGTCGRPFEKCSGEFLACMMKECRRNFYSRLKPLNGYQLRECQDRAHDHVHASQFHGCEMYRKAQGEACTCRPVKKRQRYKQRSNIIKVEL
jgi:secretory phospholipase A2